MRRGRPPKYGPANPGKRFLKANLQPATVGQVKNLIGRNDETKIFDIGLSATVISSSGSIFGPITATNQGAADGQHVGDKLKLKKVELRETMFGADASNIMRVVWFQWYSNNATTTPSVSAVLENIGFPVSSAINHTNDQSHLFKIVSDKRYAMSLSGDSAALVKDSNWYGKAIPRKIIEYNPGSNTGFYHLYCMVVSDSILVSHPTYGFYIRCHYTDD